MRRLLPLALLAVLLLSCYEEKKPPKDTYVPKTHAQELNNQAIEALKAEKKDEALALISQALEEDPQFYQAYWNKAGILGKLGRF